VKWLAVLLLGLCVSAAQADVAEVPNDPPPAHKNDFWRDVVSPHADQIQALLNKARAAINQADGMAVTDLDASGMDVKVRLWTDAYNIARYARKLAPDNLDVLTLLGRAADESGHTMQAVEVLTAAYAIAGDKASNEITGRLGMIYLRLGDLDAAIRFLRLAQAPLSGALTGQVLLHLATALSARGDMAGAIDVLQSAIPASPQYASAELVLASFALAVTLDRDEQRSAAFEVLDRLQTSQQGGFASQVQLALAGVRWAPAEDVHYYQALLYESAGDYIEARTEWALFAAIDSPWRGRALDHIAAIDKQRHDRPGPPAVAHPPQQIPRRYRTHP